MGLKSVQFGGVNEISGAVRCAQQTKKKTQPNRAGLS
jgi:hypothetical protein